MGDPSGIGLDVIVEAWLRREAEPLPPFFVTAPSHVFLDRARLLTRAASFAVEEIKHPRDAQVVFSNALPVLAAVTLPDPVVPGHPAAANAHAIIRSIDVAVDLAFAGDASAVVTSPIAKYVLMRQGFAHAGHTDYLAALAHRAGYPEAHAVMLMASSRLMAVPVTVHVPLKDVPVLLSHDLIVKTAKVTAESLVDYFNIARPRLAICGLNPHAGENGELGMEEIRIIEPAVQTLISMGFSAFGPSPADTLFHDAARESYDAVLAMYHDQALVPFKTLSFEDGVNVTLGLPFIRTSPDHGTAFSLAGTGKANPKSFIEAVHLAARMHRNAELVSAAQP